MARVSTWFHFAGNAEEAFLFCRSVFKTEFIGRIMHFGDLPPQPGQPPLSPQDAAKIMKIALPILGGHVIMGNDAPEFLGQRIQGNNVSIHLEPDTRAETDRLFAALQEGGKVEWAPAEMPWGGAIGAASSIASGTSGCSAARRSRAVLRIFTAEDTAAGGTFTAAPIGMLKVRVEGPQRGELGAVRKVAP